jgi:hypothetical protein
LPILDPNSLVDSNIIQNQEFTKIPFMDKMVAESLIKKEMSRLDNAISVV